MSDLCSIHRKVPAGWRCDDCKKYLCGECTARAANLYECCDCGRARQPARPRTHRARLLELARRRGRVPAHPRAAARRDLRARDRRRRVHAARDGQRLRGWSIAIRAIAIALFSLLVVDATARGGTGERGLALRLLRALLGTAIVWAPAAAYVYFLGVPAKPDWSLYMFGGLVAVYLPIALAVAVTDVSIGMAMNPFRVFELAWLLGRRYLSTLVASLVAGGLVVAVVTGTADKLARSVRAPVLGDVAAVLPGIAMLAIALHVIGLMVYVHGAAMGFGAASQYRDPILPKESARGKRKDATVLTTEALTKASDALTGASPEERADLRKIVEFLKGENLARALKVYESRPSWSAGAFDDRQLLALGKAALRAKNNALAQRLFEEGIAKEGRGAGQLLIAQAQLLGRRARPARRGAQALPEGARKVPGQRRREDREAAPRRLASRRSRRRSTRRSRRAPPRSASP